MDRMRRVEQSPPQLVDAFAGHGRDRHDIGIREARCARASARSRQPPRRAGRRRQIGLGQRDHAALDAEQIDNRQVLARLRHHAVVGGDDQQHEIDAGGAGQHVVHEVLVARHVDEAEHRAVRRRQIGEAEIDGDAARLLFLEPVGVDAGERAHQRGLAVIDVAGGADDHGAGSGRGRAARRSASAISSGESAARTASKNCAASALPPARARSKPARARRRGSRATPAPEMIGGAQHGLAVGIVARGGALPPHAQPARDRARRPARCDRSCRAASSRRRRPARPQPAPSGGPRRGRQRCRRLPAASSSACPAPGHRLLRQRRDRVRPHARCPARRPRP